MRVLAEPDSGYETRIYLWREQLVEEYATSGSGPSPESDQPVCACTRFDAQLQQRLLVLATYQGTARVALRCEKGE